MKKKVSKWYGSLLGPYHAQWVARFFSSSSIIQIVYAHGTKTNGWKVAEQLIGLISKQNPYERAAFLNSYHDSIHQPQVFLNDSMLPWLVHQDTFRITFEIDSSQHVVSVTVFAGQEGLERRFFSFKLSYDVDPPICSISTIRFLYQWSHSVGIVNIP